MPGIEGEYAVGGHLVFEENGRRRVRWELIRDVLMSLHPDPLRESNYLSMEWQETGEIRGMSKKAAPRN